MLAPQEMESTERNACTKLWVNCREGAVRGSAQGGVWMRCWPSTMVLCGTAAQAATLHGLRCILQAHRVWRIWWHRLRAACALRSFLSYTSFCHWAAHLAGPSVAPSVRQPVQSESLRAAESRSGAVSQSCMSDSCALAQVSGEFFNCMVAQAGKNKLWLPPMPRAGALGTLWCIKSRCQQLELRELCSPKLCTA